PRPRGGRKAGDTPLTHTRGEGLYRSPKKTNPPRLYEIPEDHNREQTAFPLMSGKNEESGCVEILSIPGKWVHQLPPQIAHTGAHRRSSCQENASHFLCTKKYYLYFDPVEIP
ncbi:MAG: hypothetical protein PHQ81_04400, partial [Methanofollis sp.]|nr:hypothetical protein [Methanofollis sp.]